MSGSFCQESLSLHEPCLLPKRLQGEDSLDGCFLGGLQSQ